MFDFLTGLSSLSLSNNANAIGPENITLGPFFGDQDARRDDVPYMQASGFAQGAPLTSSTAIGLVIAAAAGLGLVVYMKGAK